VAGLPFSFSSNSSDRVNILFVNYGDFTTNSLNHIGGFANTLCAAGQACIVAVPKDKETLAHIPSPLFIAATYEELLARPGFFPDGKPADVIHAWTPREGVRKFTIAYQRAAGATARVIIHLEDNEHFLLESYTGKSLAELQASTPAEIDAWLVDGLPHPLRHETFLRVADGVTHIIDKLRDFVPAGIPTQLLPPGVDFSLYAPQAPDAALRAELGLKDGERAIVFTGSNTFANEPEMRELYVAVALLNQRGTPTRLVRTGFNSPRFQAGLSEDLKRNVLDLGFVEKQKLPRLLALADVLVQPGKPGAFNDYRLPSKLPEFLASGRPVVLPPTNLAHLMTNGRDAVFLPTGSPDEIADTCQLLFTDPTLCATLGQNGVAFARAHFDLAANTRALGEFYAATLARPSAADWSLITPPTATETTLAFDRVGREAKILGTPAASLAADTALLAQLVRQLELALDASASVKHITQLTADRDAGLAREKLSRDHIANLEHLLAAERESSATIDRARSLTKNHADNLERELAVTRGGHREAIEAIAHYKHLKEQADALLKSARVQVVAFENALMQADARIEALENTLAVTEEALRLARDDASSARAELARERDALHAAYIAQINAERAAAAEALAQTQGQLQSREAKLKKIQSSFSWKITSPLRDLRRLFVDKPAPPTVAVSDQFYGNIDRPQDWAIIPATLNIIGWTLRRDRAPVKAIRARLGELTVAAQTGIERLDVLDHFREHPGAEHCGWMLKIEVPKRGTHSLRLEAQDEAGEWAVFTHRLIKRTTDDAPPPPNSYAAWVATYDRLTPEIADDIRAKIEAMPSKPKISVLMPVYIKKPEDEKWLIRAIESVRRQLYTNWELCISDDASPAPGVRKILANYQKKDPDRIKVVYRETNGHICANSNSALALAHGDFIALLDNDDEIRPHALACVALEINAHPDADLIYSDEDKIDENGDRYDHYFKPDWNPDLFNVQNYISHLGVYRTLLVREVGGFRVGYEGSQDWDLAMRVIERSAADRIRHIPKVLYHWRSIPGSTALVIGAKSYATNAAEKVITEHFARIGVEATITPTKGSYWRVHYPVPDPAPRVTLIIPTRNRLNFLKPCVESLLTKTTYANFDILVVDNDSNEEDTLAYLEELNTTARCRVVKCPGEFNYSAINNYGVSQTDAPIIGLLNNDLEVINPDWLDEMVSHALRPEIGCVGAKLYYPDDRIQHAGVILGIGGVAAHAWQTHPRGAAGQAHRNLLQQNLSAVTAACLVIRREVFLEVGGLNGDQLKVAFNDVDFCLKVRAAGYRNFWTPYAELYHHESASRGREDTLEKRDRFRGEVEYMRATWSEVLDNDPAYNSNLTLTINDFTLALPPREWAPLKK
jgi:glycosyltransferase involved in cell wall biosynthesis